MNSNDQDAGAAGEAPDPMTDPDRRRFLELCKKYAVGMPPAVTLLLSSTSALANHEEGHDPKPSCAQPGPSCEGGGN